MKLALAAAGCCCCVAQTLLVCFGFIVAWVNPVKNGECAWESVFQPYDDQRSGPCQRLRHQRLGESVQDLRPGAAVRDDRVQSLTARKKTAQQTHPAPAAGGFLQTQWVWTALWWSWSLMWVSLVLRVQTWLSASSWRLWRSVVLRLHMLLNSGILFI